VGGGSGGHVTPVLAVIHELKRTDPEADIRFWCDSKFNAQAESIFENSKHPMKVHTILAGKFRRYHHLSNIQHLLMPSILLPNIGDLFLVGLGVIQSIGKLIAWRPNVIFMKGGYVCLPVGVAAKLLRIPFVIHDSDAHPGLTNRILSRWARSIATGAPLEHYPYPKSISKYVGIPVASEFGRIYSEKERIEFKRKWGLKDDNPLVVVTGGGLGARRINDAVALQLDKLIEVASIVLISGKDQYSDLKERLPGNSDRFQLHAFIASDVATLFGAADLVVARAGATTILELAALARPTILIPNDRLTGGHQSKNAAVYKQKGAVVTISDQSLQEDSSVLYKEIRSLINNPIKLEQLSKEFRKFSKPDAARDVASMVVEAAIIRK
jgi:UDP-N-acetylglucosamine--N-acetylmuramyl-(pentapeptide) pyrophosphoryl-undecaprenol N-acetylglucosamine transferase